MCKGEDVLSITPQDFYKVWFLQGWLHHCWPGTGHWDRPEVALFDISIPDIGCRYIDTFKNIDIDIDIDKEILENIDIDIDIDIDKDILENIDIDIDIDKEILENIDIDIDIDKVLNQLEFGISNRASQRGIDHCKMGGPSKRTAAQNWRKQIWHLNNIFFPFIS